MANTVCNIYILFKVEDVTDDSMYSLMPVCEHADWSSMSSILDLPSILYLNAHLQKELHTPWRLLFSSRVHGESFSVLVKKIQDQGPTVLIIKDSDGHVFGGFASESWSVRPQFIGIVM